MKPEHCHIRRAAIGTALAIAAFPRPFIGQTLTKATAQTGVANMRIRCAFDRHSFTATLSDSPSVHDLASILPLDLTIEDYANNEKIAYLPRMLTDQGSGPFSGEAPGDLCYYAPWGNLAFFLGSYHYSRGLVRLGRLDEGIQPLLTKGKFSLRIELLS